MAVDWTTTPGTIVSEILHRDIDIFGDKDNALDELANFASDAWRCIEALSFAKEVMPWRWGIGNCNIKPEMLWVTFVFKLAWKGIAGSPLRAERFVREIRGNITHNVTLDVLQKMRETSPNAVIIGDWFDGSDFTSDYIYSELDDFIEASLNAIDILLSDATTTKTANNEGPPPAKQTPSPPVAEVSVGNVVRKNRLKEPPEIEMMAYRLYKNTEANQDEIAKALQKRFRVPVGQQRVSRMIRRVRKWLKAGNILPDPAKIPRAARTTDPAVLDEGERSDHLTQRQRSPRPDAE